MRIKIKNPETDLLSRRLEPQGLALVSELGETLS